MHLFMAYLYKCSLHVANRSVGVEMGGVHSVSFFDKIAFVVRKSNLAINLIDLNRNNVDKCKFHVHTIFRCRVIVVAGGVIEKCFEYLVKAEQREKNGSNNVLFACLVQNERSVKHLLGTTKNVC